MHINEIPATFAENALGQGSRAGIIFLLCVALAIVTLAVYWQTGSHEFINFDDNDYVTENLRVANGVTVENLIWAFTTFDAGNWHPITWLSHISDVQLFGMNPRCHHLTSVAIHTATSLLLFSLLFRLTAKLWQSLFVASLFALHPLHVESVAWVAERKDVLCAFFWFLTLLVYGEYAAKRKTSLYLLALGTFVLGLMSKPMLVTLPIVMLLMDFWPLGRYELEKRVEVRELLGRVITLTKEKVPFFACSLLSSIITIYAQNKSGAINGLYEYSFRLRLENAAMAYLKYIGKTVWPYDLAVFYPFPLSTPFWLVISSLLILLFISVAAIRQIRSHPYFALGWFWFLITLVPVIGIVKVGGQSMADRYTYIPITGLFIMVAWGIPEMINGLRYRQWIIGLFSGAVMITVTALTWQQLGYWRSNTVLYRHSLKVTGNNPVINYNLGSALHIKGDIYAAIHEYQQVLQMDPSYVNAHYNYGHALQTLNQFDAAIQEYKMTILLAPNHKHVHYNLGVALHEKGDFNAAIHEYQEALRLNPYHKSVHCNLGAIFQARGNLTEAVAEYKEELRISPGSAEAHYNLGLALVSKGDLDAAINEYRESLRINPNNTDARNNLATVLTQKISVSNVK